MNDQKTITIKDALTYPDKTPIPRIVGKVSLIWERTEGEGKWGPRTKQSGLMEDDSGNKMVFTVWDKPDISEHKGRKLIFRAGTGKKPSLTLVNDYKDNSKRALNASKTCFVMTEDEETDDIPMDYPDNKENLADQARNMPKPPQNPPQANVAPKRAVPVNGVQEVKMAVMQYANLREICDHAASFLYPLEGMAEPNWREKIKDVSSCFFIQGIRDGLHLKLPNNKPLSKKEDVEASEPELPSMEPEDIQF